MFALYKKYKDGYHVKVEVIAVSGDKNELMALLPYEVEKFIRERNKHMLPFELKHYYLPKGHEPIEYWSRGAFKDVEFVVSEVPNADDAWNKCQADLINLREENKKYLESIGFED